MDDDVLKKYFHVTGSRYSPYCNLPKMTHIASVSHRLTSVSCLLLKLDNLC